MLTSLAERWFSTCRPGKRKHGHHRCRQRVQQVDMYPWSGPDASLSSPDSGVEHGRQGPVSGDVDDPATASARYPAGGGPGAGDSLLHVVRTRFSRSSSSLEQVPEEIAVGICQDSVEIGVGVCQASVVMPPSSCCVRRARSDIPYRHSSHISTLLQPWSAGMRNSGSTCPGNHGDSIKGQ